MDKTRKTVVINRNRGSVSYVIPDMNNLKRDFLPGAQKELTVEELFALSQLPGGMFELKHYLEIQDPEIAQYILEENVEPEYFYTEEDIKKLLTTGTLAQFEDFLNFAPKGRIDIAQQMAVDLPLNDVAKRDLFLKKTGFDIATAISMKDEVNVAVNAPKRKAQPITKPIERKATPINK